MGGQRERERERERETQTQTQAQAQRERERGQKTEDGREKREETIGKRHERTVQ